MKLLFLGLVLSLFDLTLRFGSHTLGLLPDFLGYLLLRRAAAGFAGQSPYFQRLRGPALFLAVVTGLDYLLSLLGLVAASELAILFVLLGFATTVLQLYVYYCLACGVRGLEEALGRPIGARRLWLAWLAVAVCMGLGLLASFVTLALPGLAAAMQVVSLLAGFCGYIAYALCFLLCQRRYDAPDAPR